MPVLERSIEKTVVRLAERAGWVVRKLEWIGRRGAPDRVFFGFGRCVFIEFKRPGERPTGQQLRELERLAALYPEVHCTDNVEDALQILEIAT